MVSGVIVLLNMKIDCDVVILLDGKVLIDHNILH